MTTDPTTRNSTSEEQDPKPKGQLALQVIPMPKDTNASGDIFGGWLVSHMDMAAESTASGVAQGRIVTMAIEEMSFVSPIKVGNLVKIYTDVTAIGRTSITVDVEVWTCNPAEDSPLKVTETRFVFVSVSGNGKIRPININR